MTGKNYLGDAAVIARIVLTGRLVVKSPVCIGDGNGEDGGNPSNSKDIHVQKNKKEQPFIPGTSMCGVLRCLMEERRNEPLAALIFGGTADNEGQSLLQVYDTVLEGANLAYRDGVAINYYTGVAKDGAKYDYEVVDKGEGCFRLEAVIRQKYVRQKNEIRKAIIWIKDKLSHGIRVGAMTAKGLGLVKLEECKLGFYDLAENTDDVKAWFMKPEAWGDDASDGMKEASEQDISNQWPVFEGDFALRSTMIIRSDNVDVNEGSNTHIDQVFLKNSSGQYVVPGASFKGVLRHQARYILGKIQGQGNSAESFLNQFMGYSENIEKRSKSRFYVAESILTDAVREKVITRNRIDRVTGGVMDSALFTSVPVFQNKAGEKALHVKFFIKPDHKTNNHAEIGLVILLFRDLWQGRIAIGGETGIGRGTLKGLSGKFSIDGIEYIINEAGEVRAENGDISKLDEYVRALVMEVQ